MRIVTIKFSNIFFFITCVPESGMRIVGSSFFIIISNKRVLSSGFRESGKIIAAESGYVY